MPAHALRPEPGWHIVDCCAAPGNKTTHVAGALTLDITAPLKLTTFAQIVTLRSRRPVR